MLEKFSHKEVVKESLKYFEGDEIAADVFCKYALKNKNDYYEKSPLEMFDRLTREFSKVEEKYKNKKTYLSPEKIKSLFLDFKYVVPQGSPLSGIGNNFKYQSLSNCFLIEQPKDSYGGILYSDQEIVQIMKRRGGVGIDISTIRPKGMETANSANTTDGIGVFMERFSNSCREVAQGGRRGALMITVDVKHPEIETFINIKRNLTKVTGANVSIKIRDDFMEAVENDSEYELCWPIDAKGEDIKYKKTVKAKNIWNQIIDSAWASAEPGVLFWDTVQRNSPSDIYKKSVGTNPCSEISLSENSACRLMVINTTNYVENPFTKDAIFNYEKFEKDAYSAQILMDDLVELEIESVNKIIQKIQSDKEPDHIKKIELDLWNKIQKEAIEDRRTGLGPTGIGDTLAFLNIKYGSDQSIEVVEKIYKTLEVGAYKATIDMAEDRGAFPIFSYEKEKDHHFVKKVVNECGQDYLEKWKNFGRRNFALTTTAPVGSISILTKTTSGIEPTFLLTYKRRRKVVTENEKVDYVDKMGDKWQEYIVYHHGLKKWMEVTGLTDIKLSPYYGSTSNEIDWVQSVKLQAAAQKWVDHSLSKTCNLPENVSKELVSKIYTEAWKNGCKGFTIYRDKSRDGVLIDVNDNSNKKEKNVGNNLNALKRPKELSCDIHRVNIKNENNEMENWMVLVGMLNNIPYEIFAGLASNIEVPKKIKKGTIIKNGKKDGISTYNLSVPFEDEQIIFKDIVNLFENPLHGVFTRTVSLSLRHGVPINFIVEQLQKDKDSDMFSFNRSLARVLKTYIPDGTKSSVAKTCTNCNSTSLFYIEGCVTCSDCGYGKC